MYTFSLGYLFFVAAVCCFAVARAVWRSGH